MLVAGWTSFNDAIDKAAMLKLTMSSQSNFGQLLLKMGKNATFAKTDLTSANKLVFTPFGHFKILIF
jgi:hypothetical protein